MCLLDYSFYSDTYGAEYDLTLSAWGEGILREDALLDIQRPETIFKEFRKKHHRGPKNISLQIQDPTAVGYDFFFTGVETELLEKLEELKELILPDTITDIALTPSLEKILIKNRTLIRGSFDSFAEKFAAEHGLRFRPADLVLAEVDSTAPPQSTKLTLVFRRGGTVEIKEDVTEPGTSAGNTLGGSFSHPLKTDFYMTETAEKIAGTFSRALYEKILENGKLAAFIEKAKTHDYYKGKN